MPTCLNHSRAKLFDNQIDRGLGILESPDEWDSGVAGGLTIVMTPLMLAGCYVDRLSRRAEQRLIGEKIARGSIRCVAIRRPGYVTAGCQTAISGTTYRFI